jgi:hypothetical protein
MPDSIPRVSKKQLMIVCQRPDSNWWPIPTVSSHLELSKAKLFGNFGRPPDVSADEAFGCDGQDIGLKEASRMAVSLQAKSGTLVGLPIR